MIFPSQAGEKRLSYRQKDLFLRNKRGTIPFSEESNLSMKKNDRDKIGRHLIWNNSEGGQRAESREQRAENSGQSPTPFQGAGGDAIDSGRWTVDGGWR
jgi:hypothetical protein